MTNLSVADSITIIEPSKSELESAQELLKIYLMRRTRKLGPNKPNSMLCPIGSLPP
jgi:hypothetical protein